MHTGIQLSVKEATVLRNEMTELKAAQFAALL